jgi:hypothetical protein
MELGMIVIFLAIVFAVSVWALEHSNYGNEGLWGGLIFCSALLFAILTIACVASYLGSIKTVSELDAFYSSTKYTYANVITESENIEINLPIEENVLISARGLTYFKLATAVSGKISGFGMAIEKYNKNLFRLIYYNDNWFLDGFYKDVPKHLKPIILTLK